MRGINVYDFDGTIFAGDCTWDFYLYCLRRHPSLTGQWPAQGAAVLGFLLGRRDKRHLKEAFWGFLACLPCPAREVDAYWDSRFSRIKPWYLAQRHPSDVVVTGSPEFLVAPALARLGAKQVIGTCIHPDTGKMQGSTCLGREKVRRFTRAFPEAMVQNFYSDHISDAPMAGLSRRAFFVRGNCLRPWPQKGR